MRSEATEGLIPITVRVAAATKLTGISRSRLYELMRSGDIEFVKVGASTLILVESLKRLIEHRRTRSCGRDPDS